MPALLADVIVIAPLDRALTYRVPDGMALAAGDLARVPLGSRTALGVVTALREFKSAPEGLKPVTARIGADGLRPEWREALLSAAAEFMTPPGLLLSLALPPQRRAAPGRWLRLTKFAGAEPLSLLALKPHLRSGAVPFGKIKKTLGPAWCERELPALIAGGWVAQTDARPAPAGMERWLHWNDSSAPLPPRQKRAASLRDFMGSAWHRQIDLYARFSAAHTLAPALLRSGLLEESRRPAQWDGTGALAAEAGPERLNAEQQAAALGITAAVEAKAARKFLLTGPTGSGKSAVFIHALAASAKAGRPGLLLVPEINLLPQTLARLRASFGVRVAVFHSEMADGARAAAWERVRTGDFAVACGVRSAVFAPFSPGLIVIDEEQEGSYKQAGAPAYSARHLAYRLADISPCPLVLVSATPSLESFHASRAGGPLTHLALTRRAGHAQLPAAVALDMRGSPREEIIHPELLAAVREALARGEQALLMRNRRGWAPQVICRSCGLILSCESCAAALTLHHESGQGPQAGHEFLLCHLCGARRVRPAHCPGCGGDYLALYGSGAQRLFDEALAKIPEARPARLDRDSARGARGAAEILGAFKSGKTNLLVGTQMLAKGHDVPAVTVVGVLAADGLLGLPDYRAAERLFALLTQVIGRAGRGDQPGRAYIQALTPEHYAVAAALQQDYDAFYQQEIRLRQLGGYPPFGALARLLLSGENSDDTFAQAEKLAQRLQSLADPGLRLLGPAFCPIEKIQNRYRVQIILKGRSRSFIAQQLRAALPDRRPQGMRIEMDPDTLS